VNPERLTDRILWPLVKHRRITGLMHAILAVVSLAAATILLTGGGYAWSVAALAGLVFHDELERSEWRLDAARRDARERFNWRLYRAIMSSRKENAS
jgi:ABC-type transport system involved in cytochrome bd biosynthesis fused ATPase/permease subunit